MMRMNREPGETDKEHELRDHVWRMELQAKAEKDGLSLMAKLVAGGGAILLIYHGHLMDFFHGLVGIGAGLAATALFYIAIPLAIVALVRLIGWIFSAKWMKGGDPDDEDDGEDHAGEDHDS